MDHAELTIMTLRLSKDERIFEVLLFGPGEFTHVGRQVWKNFPWLCDGITNHPLHKILLPIVYFFYLFYPNESLVSFWQILCF